MDRSQRLAARVAVVAVFALVVAGCGFFPSPTQEAAAVSATPAALATRAPTPLPLTTPEPTPTPPTGPTLSWAPVLASNGNAKLAPKLGGGISAALAFPGGFVLAGSDSQGRAIVWYSPDGTKWQPVEGVPGFEDGVIRNLVPLPEGLLANLVPTPGGLLAVGTGQKFDSLCAGAALGCNPVAPIRFWTSTDGLDWRALPTSVAAPFGRAQLDQIVPGPSGLVAFGELVPATGTNITAMVWTSPDGRVWTRAPQFPTAFPTDTIADLAAGPGGYAAVGSRSVGGNLTQSRRAWYSVDGRTWQRASGPGAQGPTVVMTCEGGFFGVDSPSAQATFWTSADGVNWRVQPAVVGRPNYPAYVGSGLYSDGTRILAMGADSFQTRGAWLSTDGLEWQPIALSGVQPPTDSAVIGSVVGTLGPKGAIVTTATQVAAGLPTWTVWFGTLSQ